MSPPIVSLLAAPPPGLSPTRKIPLNALAPTFVPRTPCLSRAGVAKFPLETQLEHGFQDLIAILNELSVDGDSTPRFSTVFSFLRDRKPDTFETVDAAQFKVYLQLAESAGIASIEQRQDGDWWITLCDQQNTDSRSPQRHPPPKHARSRFCDLIKTLNDLRLAGDPEPQLSIVGPRLQRMNPSIFEDVGVRGFEEYVQAAAEAGVVAVRGVRSGDGSLRLCPGYCSPPVCSPTPTRAARIPPTRAASTASPFSPLVEFLKFKRLSNTQPISFSRVYAHLFSTLGYADLVSLYASIPGVTTFSQYIDVAIAAGLVSLAWGPTTAGNAGRVRGVGL